MYELNLSGKSDTELASRDGLVFHSAELDCRCSGLLADMPYGVGMGALDSLRRAKKERMMQGKGLDANLQGFMQGEFKEGMVLEVENLSCYYYGTPLISGVDVNASLSLRHSPHGQFIGLLDINAIDSKNYHSKRLSEFRRMVVEREGQPFVIPINDALNYMPGKSISFYSPRAGNGSSWSLHCLIDRTLSTSPQ